MSYDREEIRWKFQVLLDMIRTAKNAHENEQNGFYESGILLISELKEVRNNLLAGIGFAIGILISLISIG